MRPDRGPDDVPAAPWWKTSSGIVMCGFLLVAGFYVATEHTAHLFGVLPFLLILACPLMHLFHHHGHGGLSGLPSPTGVAGPDRPQEDRS